jgi:hypothetical protein
MLPPVCLVEETAERAIAPPGAIELADELFSPTRAWLEILAMGAGSPTHIEMKTKVARNSQGTRALSERSNDRSGSSATVDFGVSARSSTLEADLYLLRYSNRW